MFKPHRYLKRESAPARRQSPPQSRWRTPATLLAIMTLSLGLYSLGSQVLVPLLSSHPSVPLVEPVVGIFDDYQPTGSTTVLGEVDPPPPFFYLSIPDLGIEEIPVETNSTRSPDRFLAHIKGSGLPGTAGTPIIISGHSVTPWFFDGNDPGTVFARLDKLGSGDEISIRYRGKDYHYEVTKSEVVAPKDLWSRLYSTRSAEAADLILFTCVPPGLETNRLLVFSRKVVGVED